MKTTEDGSIPIKTRWDVRVFDSRMTSYMYYTDSFDDIDEAHKPLCMLLDAAFDPNASRTFGSGREVRLEGVGRAVYYNHCPPMYSLNMYEWNKQKENT